MLLFNLLLVYCLTVQLLWLYRHSNLFPSKEHCFLTFEPDSLDVPQSFDGPYSIYFTPNSSASEHQDLQLQIIIYYSSIMMSSIIICIIIMHTFLRIL